MPASIFAAWAGQHGVAESWVRPGTTGAKAANPAAVAGVITFANTEATTTSCPALRQSRPVTAVTQRDKERLPPKNIVCQGDNRSNPSNPPISLRSSELGANDPAAWRALFQSRVGYRLKSGDRTPADAEVLAFGDCLVQWHWRYGARPDPRRCVGCGDPFIDDDLLDLGSGVRVHLDARLSCLTRYGQTWRRAAVQGCMSSASTCRRVLNCCDDDEAYRRWYVVISAAPAREGLGIPAVR
jgi:hypothetical protein